MVVDETYVEMEEAAYRLAEQMEQEFLTNDEISEIFFDVAWSRTDVTVFARSDLLPEIDEPE